MISSVGDFLNVVNKIYPHNENVFFRGVSSHKYNVVSSLCRLINDNELNDSAADVAGELFENFKNKLPSYPEFSALKNYNINDVDVLMTAQHYGIPTRLIDLTINPLVALYFAVESYKYKEDKNEEEDKISVYVIKDTADKKIKLKSSDSILKGFELEEENIKNITKFIIESDFLIGNLNSKQNLPEDISKAKEKIKEINRFLDSVFMEEEFFSYNTKCLLPTSPGNHSNYIESIDYSSKKLSAFLCNKELSLKDCRNVIDKLYEDLISNWSCNQKLNPVMRRLYGDDFFVIEPLPVNDRIKNQQGFFLFSKKIDSAEIISNSFKGKLNVICDANNIADTIEKESIIRIDISCKYAKNIGKELEHYGIKKSFIYPELASFSEEQKARFVRKK